MRYSQAKSNIAISIFVVLLKHVRHSLQADTSLHKQIEAHCFFVSPVIRSEQDLYKLRRQSVTECDEGLAELAIGNIAGVIDIKLIKEVAPCGKKSP
jgi:hypothetical protein